MATASVEALEQRQLLSASLSNGLLTVTGNVNSPNNLIVRMNSEKTEYIVGDNDTRRYFAVSAVKEIKIIGGDKDDFIDVYPNTPVPATIYGGKGNDRLFGGKMNDKIYGGDGDDYIDGRGGNDELHGEAGNDTIDAGNGKDIVYGGDGDDTITTNNTNDSVFAGSGKNTINGKVVSGGGNNGGGSSNPAPTNPTPVPTPTPTPTPTPSPVAGAPNAVIRMINSSVMAGQAIHVHAMDTKLNAGDPIHSNYEWDFGDPDGDYNRLNGFNAAHVYDKAGTYTITLKVTNSSGKSTVVASKVTITADTRKKVYVDAVAGSDSNPGTIDKPIKTLPKAQSLFGDNTAIYLKRGQTHAGTVVLWLNYSNIVLGAYGTGSRPVIMNKTGNSTVAMDGTKARDVMIEGITFDTEGAATNGVANKIGVKAVWAKGTNITVRDNQFLNVSDAVQADGQPTGLLVQDNIAPLDTGIRSYFIWSEGTDHVYLGNNVANSTREHIVRVGASGTERLLMAHNTFSNISRSSVDPSDQAKGSMVIHKASYVWLSHNNVIGGGGTGFGPLGGENGLSDKGARFQWGVLENNVLETALIVNHGSENLMFRNNILMRNEGAMITVSGWNDEFNRGIKNLYIYNNTGVTDGTRGNFLKVEGKTDGIWMANNLFVAPSYTTGSHNSAIVYVAESNLNSFREISHNVWANATTLSFAEGGLFYVWPSWSDKKGYLTPTEWAAYGVVGTEFVGDVILSGSYTPSSSSIAAKAGKVIPGVFADLYDKSRPGTGGWTVGAVQV